MERYKYKPQSRSASFIESLIRAAFNYFTALAIQLLLFPAFFHSRIQLWQNLCIGLVFMANSIVGGYVWRRIFNARAAPDKPIPVGVRAKSALQRLHRIADGNTR